MVERQQANRWQETRGGANAAPCNKQRQRYRPRWHSLLHRVRQLSFHAGTWCTAVHTARWQASVHASTLLVPQTVTHVLGVASCVRRGSSKQGGTGCVSPSLPLPLSSHPEP